MGNELMIFEGEQLEVLTKKDVNIKFDGDVLFNGKQSAKILEYKNDRDALKRHIRDSQKYLIKSSDVVKHDFRKLNNAGETFITEKGVMKLIINSEMPKANEFEDKVWDIVESVRKTGKFDVVENKINKIEDEKEKELTLGLYSLEQALKTNPNDISISILVNLKKGELNTYKQQKQLEEINNKVGDMGKRIENFITIGDRVQFVHEVNSVCRATGVKQSEIYNGTYIKLKELYGIDLKARSRNEKERIQNDRINEGKKPYSPNTLNNKAGCLVIADEKSIWNELGKSLFAVRDELLKNKEEI